jgi:hypothetical protein
VHGADSLTAFAFSRASDEAARREFRGKEF